DAREKLRIQTAGDKDADKLLPLLEVTGGWLTVAVKDDIECEASLSFPDRAKAKAGAEAVSDFVDEKKAKLGESANALRAAGLANVDRLVENSKKELDQIRPRQSGSRVVFGWKSEGE